MRLAPNTLGRSRRRGAMVAMLLVLLGVFLAAMALAIDGSNLWSARTEMQASVDAAALAAASSLADDALLADTKAKMPVVLAQARDQARQFAFANPVLASPLELVVDAQNEPNSDVVFGYLESRRTGFQPAPANQLNSPFINAVRVVGRRTKSRGNPARLFLGRVFQLGSTDVIASATAYLDRDVVGFRPVGRQAIPLAPVALLSDPLAMNELSWEGQTVKPAATDSAGCDAFVYDPGKKRFHAMPAEAPRGDGIYEMEVRLVLQGTSVEETDEENVPNGVLLHIGQGDAAALCRQLVSGIGEDDLHETGGQFRLGWDAQLILPAQYMVFDQQHASLGQLINALKFLESSCEPRIWPLFQSLRPTNRFPQAHAAITGFVAARVAYVELTTDPQPCVRLVLQPCQLITATALTDRTAVSCQGTPMTNPYISRLRLAE